MFYEILFVILIYCFFSKLKDNLISNNINDDFDDFLFKLVDEYLLFLIKFFIVI